MRLSEAYQPGNLVISFELFPPKSSDSETDLFHHVAELVRFEPGFITCTYGAGGSTRDKTLSIVERVNRDFGLSVAAHLTCVGSHADQLRDYLAEARRRGVENIVALRGDPPSGETQFHAVEGGLAYANQLVKLIREEFPTFGIAVAGYPETHVEAKSAEADLDYLARKVDAGADIVITQLFYHNDDFFRFRESCQRRGIRVPIVPGVLPVTNFSQIQRITALCGAKLPPQFVADLQAHHDDIAGQFQVGVEHATQQVQELIDGGVPGVHFYVLNKSQAAARVLSSVTRPGK